MLLGNGSVLHKLPLKFYGGSATSVEPQLVNNFDKSGPRRNRILIEQRTTALNLFAVPTGYYAQSAWFLPQKAGEISSHEFARAEFTQSALAVGGVTTTASSSLTFTVADATGGLISSGSGTAALAFTIANLTLTGSIAGAGAASFAITSNTPLLGALAGGVGQASMTVTIASAQAYPLNDASPLRTAGASFVVSGSLIPYAIGSISGSTLNGGALTEASIANAVWSSASASYTDSTTMGAKLNSAASGGVDYGSMAGAVRTELQAELLRIVELAKIHGLVIGSDLVVTPTSRTAGGVVQSLSDTAGTTTVSRTA